MNRRKFLKAGFKGAVLSALPVSSMFSFPRADEGTRIRRVPSWRDPEKVRLKQLIGTYGGEFGGFNSIREED